MATKEPELKPAPPAPAAPLEQAPLFALEQLPDESRVIDAVKRYQHKAKAVTQDEERAFAICEALLVQGQGIRATCRRFAISHNTLGRMLRVLEASGKLDTYKQRMATKLGLLVELSTEACIEKVIAGEVQANVLPIMLGVASDKKAALDGDATIRIETVETRRLELADITQYLKGKGLAIDVESTVSPTIPQESEAKP